MNLSELRQKPHISASSVGDYLECGMLYRFGRLDVNDSDFVIGIIGKELLRAGPTFNMLMVKILTPISWKVWIF